MKPGKKLPEWAPLEGGSGFATRVVPGVAAAGGGDVGSGAKSCGDGWGREVDPEVLFKGLRNGDRAALARAITLVESTAAGHRRTAREIVRRALEQRGSAVRIGITGVPGSGKSTLIEVLGVRLCADNHRVAVLAVDPSSSRSRGSVLGDKTRMESLSRHPNAFIRPSPTGGVLGGVTRKSRETILLCEAAGYDVILVETVGTGQNEITVRSMVDVFVVLCLAGAGDELQGIKKGVLELADILVVNKADGDNLERAEMARGQLEQTVSLLAAATEGWTTPVYCCSALDGAGIQTLWSAIGRFVEEVRSSGAFERRRRDQNIEWTRSLLDEGLRAHFFSRPGMKDRLARFEAEVGEGRVSAVDAVERLLDEHGGAMS